LIPNVGPWLGCLRHCDELKSDHLKLTELIHFFTSLTRAEPQEDAEVVVAVRGYGALAWAFRQLDVKYVYSPSLGVESSLMRFPCCRMAAPHRNCAYFSAHVCGYVHVYVCMPTKERVKKILWMLSNKERSLVHEVSKHAGNTDSEIIAEMRENIQVNDRISVIYMWANISMYMTNA
jgi:hypothetical protein